MRILSLLALPVLAAVTVLFGPLVATAESSPPSPGWSSYGGDPGGRRFADLDQIDRSNVAGLEVAWTYRSGDLGEGFASRDRMAFEATPILAEGRLYLSTPFSIVVALDPATGRELWRFDPGLDPNRRFSEATSRGVASWRAAADEDGICAHRILFATLDARLVALDGATGAPCAGFGEDGQVNLARDVRLGEPGEYTMTSPPAVAGDVVVVGSAIGDNRKVDSELGIVRGFDVRSGALLWSWDPIPRDAGDPGHRHWQSAQAARTGAANAWAPLSVDVERDLVFIPTSAPSPDFYGGERQGDNRYANSLVALRASSGALVWFRQLVHHDLWDYDIPAQPLLVTLERDGEAVPAVVQATKMGLLFTFHRETGEPLFPIEQRPVPASDVPGEAAWPTQPFPVAPPPLVSHAPVTPDDAWGLTFIDRGACRDALAELRAEGIYTPPSLQGTLLYPSYAGGMNWGSLAYDPVRRLAIANTNHVPAVVKLVPREDLAAQRASGALDGFSLGRQEGTPYVMARKILFSPLGVPCTPPPWGKLAAVDMAAGEIRWQVPLGTTAGQVPLALNYGVPNLGGPLATAGGLVFIAAATDNRLRAFDVDSGEILWTGDLPAGGQATPMTYRDPRSGRQFVVIAAGGHGRLGTDLGDYVVAFALPPEAVAP